MSKFLLDTNICIYFLKGKFNLISKIEKIGLVNCFISEITVAELKYGAEKSEQIVENKKKVELLLNKFTVIPIYTSLDVYAKEKTKLSKKAESSRLAESRFAESSRLAESSRFAESSRLAESSRFAELSTQGTSLLSKIKAYSSKLTAPLESDDYDELFYSR